MKRWYYPAIWGLIITVLSVVPTYLLPRSPRTDLWQISIDKVGHFCFYAIFAGLVAWTIRSGNSRHRVLIAVGLTAAYGVLMEYIQYSLVESRFFEIDDIIANIIGSLAGGLTTVYLILKDKL